MEVPACRQNNIGLPDKTACVLLFVQMTQVLGGSFRRLALATETPKTKMRRATGSSGWVEEVKTAASQWKNHDLGSVVKENYKSQCVIVTVYV